MFFFTADQHPWPTRWSN